MVAHGRGGFDGRDISLPEHRPGGRHHADRGRIGRLGGFSILSFQKSHQGYIGPVSDMRRDAQFHRAGMQVLRQRAVDRQLTGRAANATAASLVACLRTAGGQASTIS